MKQLALGLVLGMGIVGNAMAGAIVDVKYSTFFDVNDNNVAHLSCDTGYVVTGASALCSISTAPVNDAPYYSTEPPVKYEFFVGPSGPFGIAKVFCANYGDGQLNVYLTLFCAKACSQPAP